MRGKFARLCVQIDLKKSLIPMVHVMGHNQRIEYERLHRICFECGQYGHRAEGCPAKLMSVNQTGVMDHTPQILQKNTHLNEASAENPFGPWKLVTSGRRRNLLSGEPDSYRSISKSFAQQQDNGPRPNNHQTGS